MRKGLLFVLLAILMMQGWAGLNEQPSILTVKDLDGNEIMTFSERDLLKYGAL